MIHEEKDGPLVTMSVRDFVMTVGARSATPGGGSVAAMVASLVSILGLLLRINFHTCVCPCVKC